MPVLNLRYIDLTILTCRRTRVGEADFECHRREADIREWFPGSVVVFKV